MLALGDAAIAEKVERYKAGLTQKIVAANEALAEVKYKFKTN